MLLPAAAVAARAAGAALLTATLLVPAPMAVRAAAASAAVKTARPVAVESLIVLAAWLWLAAAKSPVAAVAADPSPRLVRPVAAFRPVLPPSQRSRSL